MRAAQSSAELASAEYWPDGFDLAVADGVELFVEVDGGVGVTDDELDFVADVGSIGGVLHFDGSVLGGEAYSTDGAVQKRLRHGAIATHGFFAGVADDARGRGSAG